MTFAGFRSSLFWGIAFSGFTPVFFFFVGLGLAAYKDIALERSVGISSGAPRSVVEAKMVSAGFSCSEYSGKYISLPPPTETEIWCSKKEYFGLGLAGSNSRFLFSIFPSQWLYDVLPKDKSAMTIKYSAFRIFFDRNSFSEKSADISFVQN